VLEDKRYEVVHLVFRQASPSEYKSGASARSVLADQHQPHA
jgi:hypothetical protein